MTEIAVAIAAILLCVGIHYEALAICSRLLPRLRGGYRIRVAFAILGGLTAHVAEIMVWAGAIGGAQAAGIGELAPATTDPRDVVYFSITSYTTLGYGDIVPHGPLRLIVALESLTGFVMISWTASFTYLQMERFWGSDEQAHVE